MYFKKINIKAENSIRSFAISDINRFLSSTPWNNTQTRIKHKLPDEILNSVNEELNSYGIPKILYCQSYIRKKGNCQGIHIDGTNGELINAAINIPLQGCNNSKFTWYSGDYDLVERNIGDLYFYNLKWKSVPQVASTLELTDSHLVRVNMPHSAQASFTEDRWIFTMRFVGNPTFEELYEKLPNCKVL
jgi:hypothetical protein